MSSQLVSILSLVVFILTVQVELMHNIALSQSEVDDVPKLPSLIGITYRPKTPGIPKPEDVVEKLMEEHVERVRIIDPDVGAITAFSGTKIDISVAVEDMSQILSFAKDSATANEWVVKTLLPAKSTVKISTISVGSTLYWRDRRNGPIVLPAVKAVTEACRANGLLNTGVTSTESFGMFNKTWPPFTTVSDNQTKSYMIPLLKYYSTNGGLFMLEAYPRPYFQSGIVPGANAHLASFSAKPSEYLMDKMTGVPYSNLYDMMVDCTYIYLSGLGFTNIPIVVAATGWTSSELTMARRYNQGLIDHINNRNGTPYRRFLTSPAYIEGLFDDDPKKNVVLIKDLGIWHNDMTPKYPLAFGSGVRMGSPDAISITALLSCAIFFVLLYSI